ncbi:hypothetical protein TUBRATIS_30080 [Tubulinosema ratisbonensis]|uniref:Uncharacterized protein n=1 Tax=Tubulinosema ratisbonensis TaxID=291195 RepID=A0A437AHH4_9MICR|nr:hypothetical protein TUBRATIS_30080 [Tubulinosema ratisbonensis]
MFNYISSFKDSIIVINKNKLICVNNGTIKELNHSNNIVIIEENYFIDSEKNLYKVDKDVMRFITKLEKGVSKLCFYKNNLFLADRFGDVYKISEKNELILGNLTYNTSLVIHNDLIYTSDKYGRIRISDLKGTILSYEFISKNPIISMCMISKGLVVCTTTKLIFLDIFYKINSEFDISNIRKVIKFDDESVLVLADKTMLFNSQGLISTFEFAFDACVNKNDIFFINKEKDLIYDKKILLKLQDDFLNYLDNLK